MIVLYNRRLLLAIAIMVVLISLSACKSDSGQIEPHIQEPDTVEITFSYEKQSGYATNQFAVWIEDTDGNLIQTLYATRFTANGGYKNRADAIPLWVEKSSLASMEKVEIDAVTGATPKAGTQVFVWDLTDASGNAVLPGEYSFFVEGSLRWKNRVLHSGVIEIGDIPSIATANAEFLYEASDDQPALSGDATENIMIGTVTATFKPAA